MCEAARKRLAEIEADLRRRLSGPDRSVEAVQLERLAAGIRTAEGLETPRGEDPLLEQGALALCAAQLLGVRPMVHLVEGLALRGLRVRRSSLAPDQPPRALEVIEQIHRGEHPLREREPVIEVCRTTRNSPAARTLVALSAAGLAPPLVLLDAGAGEERSMSLWHAGLGPSLLQLVQRAAAPHPVEDAAAPMAVLREALVGRNPWHLYQLVEVPWRDAWAGTQVLREPQLTLEGQELARHVLGRPASAEESFALACYALGQSERLAQLQGPSGPPPLVDESAQNEREALLRHSLTRLLKRPLLPGPGGESALLLKQAVQSGLFVVMAHHPDEMGRALLPAEGGRSVLVRLFSFPREQPRAIVGSERIEDGRRTVCLDGGDLRAQLCHPAI